MKMFVWDTGAPAILEIGNHKLILNMYGGSWITNIA